MDDVRVVTLTVTVSPLGRFTDVLVWEYINPDRRHRTNSLGRTFAEVPLDRATLLFVPLVVDVSRCRRRGHRRGPAGWDGPHLSAGGVSVVEAIEQTGVVNAWTRRRPVSAVV